MVYIAERKHSRAASGNIRLMADNNCESALFAPTDHRVPRFIIPMSDCPHGNCVAQTPFLFLKFLSSFSASLLVKKIFPSVLCRYCWTAEGHPACKVPVAAVPKIFLWGSGITWINFGKLVQLNKIQR